jgi:hypothetical protein
VTIGLGFPGKSYMSGHTVGEKTDRRFEKSICPLPTAQQNSNFSRKTRSQCMGAIMDLVKIERLLARPAKGDVSSMDSLAAIAAALLDIAGN